MTEYESCNDSKIFIRKESLLRWVILLLSSFSAFGAYYCIDNVSVLHDSLKTHLNTLNENNFEYYFSLLYSVYNIPNIILPLIGGILMIKFGMNILFVLIGLFLIIGQFLFALGCSYKTIHLMLVGRVFFGFGGEIINLIQNCMMMKWFKKSELSFPFGIAITVSRLGSVLNAIISPRISSKSEDPSMALWAGEGIVVFSFICSLVLIFIDKYIDNVNIHTNDETTEDDEEVDLKSMFNFSYLLWLIILCCLIFYAGFIPFNNIASGYLTNKFKNMPKKDSENLAGSYIAIPFFISTFMVPLFGILIDKIGKRSYFIIASSLLGMLAFISLEVFDPLVGMILIGITYSLFASVLWPTISIITSKKLAGLAFGVASSIQNFGLALIPILVASLITNYKSYDYAIAFFVIVNVVAFVISIIIIIEDSRLKGIINNNKFKEEFSLGKDDENKEDDEDRDKLIKSTYEAKSHEHVLGIKN